MRMSRRFEMDIGSVSVCTRSGRFGKDRLSWRERLVFDYCICRLSGWAPSLMLDEGRVPAEEF